MADSSGAVDQQAYLAAYLRRQFNKVFCQLGSDDLVPGNPPPVDPLKGVDARTFEA